MSETQRLFLIDAYSHIHRAYHAIAGLSTSRGEPTNALFGFLTILNRLVKTYQPTHLVAVFDSVGPTFRKDLYEEYKTNRPPMPEDLQVQIPRIKTILDMMNITRFEAPSFEADDLIATLVHAALEQGVECWICSVDKDLFQLIGPGVKMLRTHRDQEEVFDSERVKEKMGVSPAQIPDYLGLIGDASDNIPGVPGIGPKSAVGAAESFWRSGCGFGSGGGNRKETMARSFDRAR